MARAEYKNAARSRRLICRALVDLLHEKPLEKITVTDIVTRADINRGTFYAHYSGIPDVVENIIENSCVPLREALSDYAPGKMSDPAVVLNKLQSMLEKDQEFYQKILNSNIAILFVERLRQVVIEYILQHEKEFPAHNHDDYIFSVIFGSGGVIMMYVDWFSGRLSGTLSELTEKAVSVIQWMVQESKKSK